MNYIQIILKSLGQVMFQNNPYSGLLFLIGIVYNSPLLGLAAILGVVVSVSSAQILNYSRIEIQNGIYGFNGALIGIALWHFFGVNVATVFALILASALTSPLYYYLKKIIPPYTAPFVTISWISIYLFLLIFDFPLVNSSKPINHDFDLIVSSAKSFGQVMFQENTITGLLFLLAIAINSKRSAIYALFAAVLGSVLAILINEPVSYVNAGLMGYNAILCAIALADKQRNWYLWISIATILCVILTILFARFGYLALTAPFVLSTWIVLKLDQSRQSSDISF